MSFAELMKHVQSLSFDVTVFDTAPTGHTLRLLSLPGTMETLISKVMGLRERFGPMLSTFQAMMGGGGLAGLPSESTIFGKLDEIKGGLEGLRGYLPRFVLHLRCIAGVGRHCGCRASSNPQPQGNDVCLCLYSRG